MLWYVGALATSFAVCRGRQHERWRFFFEDSASARLHALIATSLGPLGNGSRQQIHTSLSKIVSFAGSGGELDPVSSVGSVFRSFPEIPASELSESFWVPVYHCKWQCKQNILGTEAQPLCFGVKHKFRSSPAFGHKYLLC